MYFVCTAYTELTQATSAIKKEVKMQTEDSHILGRVGITVAVLIGVMFALIAAANFIA